MSALGLRIPRPASSSLRLFVGISCFESSCSLYLLHWALSRFLVVVVVVMGSACVALDLPMKVSPREVFEKHSKLHTLACKPRSATVDVNPRQQRCVPGKRRLLGVLSPGLQHAHISRSSSRRVVAATAAAATAATLFPDARVCFWLKLRPVPAASPVCTHTYRAVLRQA